MKGNTAFTPRFSAAETMPDAEERSSSKGGATFRRMRADVRIQAALGQFYGAKLRAGVLYGIHEQTGDRGALEAALERYRAAREMWRSRQITFRRRLLFCARMPAASTVAFACTAVFIIAALASRLAQIVGRTREVRSFTTRIIGGRAPCSSSRPRKKRLSRTSTSGHAGRQLRRPGALRAYRQPTLPHARFARAPGASRKSGDRAEHAGP